MLDAGRLVGVVLDPARRQRQAGADAKEMPLRRLAPPVQEEAEVGDSLQGLRAMVDVAERGAGLGFVAGLDVLDVVGQLGFDVPVNADGGVDGEEDAIPVQLDDVLVGQRLQARMAAVEARELDPEPGRDAIDRTGRRFPRERGIASGRSALQEDGEEERHDAGNGREEPIIQIYFRRR